MSNKIKPGEIYVSDDSEFIGSFPIRTEITVLPADEPKERTIGWAVVERNGGEVYKLDADGINLTNFSDLKKGDDVLVPTLFGYVQMKITKRSRIKKTATAESEGTLAWLEFSKDDRKCWTSSSSMNKKLLKNKNLKLVISK
jgi:hypothetical protein